MDSLITIIGGIMNLTETLYHIKKPILSQFYKIELDLNYTYIILLDS